MSSTNPIDSIGTCVVAIRQRGPAHLTTTAYHGEYRPVSVVWALNLLYMYYT